MLERLFFQTLAHPLNMMIEYLNNSIMMVKKKLPILAPIQPRDVRTAVKEIKKQ